MEDLVMVALGNDHTGYAMKKAIMEYLDQRGIEYKDFGCGEVTTSNYPDYAKAVGRAIQKKECDKGILICGTGIGISITANKMKGIRAALCHDCFSAEATRLHNNANVLAMGARVIGVGHALKIVDIFLNTEFSNDERHIKRIDMMEEG
jgi:ribose 5-phosphate isomerase B